MTEVERKIIKKPVSVISLISGAIMQTFEVSTLGQPFEVVKTHVAANRNDNLRDTLRKTYARGGLKGFYQGLIPWGLIEAVSKGAVVIVVASEVEYRALLFGLSPFISGLLAGLAGGFGQTYIVMGWTTFLKTCEITRKKNFKPNANNVSIYHYANQIIKEQGITGMYKGATAICLRQCTNWAGRFAIPRFIETIFKRGNKNEEISIPKRIIATFVGGGLACWNQPLEVIRVEMQSQIKTKDTLKKKTILSVTKYIYEKNGIFGFYRGLIPRMMCNSYLTVCMVFGTDMLRSYLRKHYVKS